MKNTKKQKKKQSRVTGLEIVVFVMALLCLGAIVFIRASAAKLEKDALSPEPSQAPVVIRSEDETSPVSDAVPPLTPAPTPEPQPEFFTLTLVGDCTLWSNKNYANHPAGFAGTINGDYSWPFSNAIEYTGTDDLTLANLECILSDTALTVDYTKAVFSFLAPTAYSGILTEGGVDFVTIANNHITDCYESGLNSTKAALEEAGVPYGYEAESQIITTESGLKVGIFTCGVDMRPDWKKDKAVEAVKSLREQGAEYVVCMFHWGNELEYKPFDFQVDLAHACVDAGADLIYGSHSHCLQPVEEYNGAPIFYSLGNWSFGGHTAPSDPDTVLVQVSVKRDVDGTVSTDGYVTVPYCVSGNIDGALAGALNYNDYRPTPYPEDSDAYYRVLAKLEGSFQPTSHGVDYSNWYASQG